MYYRILDHTLPENLNCLISSVLLGSRAIEKHFSLDKNLSGNDHFHSFDPSDLKRFKKIISNFLVLLGDGSASVTHEISRKNGQVKKLCKFWIN